jgi:regulator of sirC expression with transglutaminase-like and TPR domain
VSGVLGTFSSITAELRAVVTTEPIDLARAALVIAKLEYPRLDPAPSLARLRELGDQAAHATKPLAGAPARDLLATISHELYEKAGFAGNREHYDDFRNSLLNVVLERRLGIPITLALVFMEVARQANVDVQGVGFPGHFLLRVPEADSDQRPLILDPYDRGRELGELDCRALLSEMMGDESEYSPNLLRPCSPRQMLARMLNNLKRTYVEMRSFPQAYAATDMILAVDPTLLPELRDRGLLAYHLDDFPSALRDLEDYLRLNSWSEDSSRKEREEIWNHVRNLRRRVAGLN